MAGATWLDAAVRLHQAGMLDKDTTAKIAVLWHFGKLIANSDMHEGNLSFVPGILEGGSARHENLW